MRAALARRPARSAARASLASTARRLASRSSAPAGASSSSWCRAIRRRPLDNNTFVVRVTFRCLQVLHRVVMGFLAKRGIRRPRRVPEPPRLQQRSQEHEHEHEHEPGAAHGSGNLRRVSPETVRGVVGQHARVAIRGASRWTRTASLRCAASSCRSASVSNWCGHRARPPTPHTADSPTLTKVRP